MMKTLSEEQINLHSLLETEIKNIAQVCVAESQRFLEHKMVFFSSEGLALDNNSAGFYRGWKSIGSFPVGPLTTSGCAMF